MEFLAQPHHDGSELYAPEPPVELGAETTVLLRVPREARVAEAAVRYVSDAEPYVTPAEIEERRAATVATGFSMNGFTTRKSALSSMIESASIEQNRGYRARLMPTFKALSAAGQGVTG